MTVTRGFVIILASGLVFALGGGSIGYTLGVTAPGYYRAVYSSGREPWFDPVSVGLGLGITQGLVCGLVIGAVVVLAVAWASSRRGALRLELPAERAPRRSVPPERLSGEQGITGWAGR
jgi:hypothetical protein